MLIEDSTREMQTSNASGSTYTIPRCIIRTISLDDDTTRSNNTTPVSLERHVVGGVFVIKSCLKFRKIDRDIP